MKKLVPLLALLCSASAINAVGEKVFDRDVIMNGALDVEGVATLASLIVNTDATINGPIDLNGNVSINGNRLNINGNNGRTNIAGSLNVGGNTTLNALTAGAGMLDSLSIANGGDLRITGSTRLLGQLSLNQDAVMFDVMGSATFNGPLNVNNDVFIANDKSLYVNMIEPVDPTTSTTFSGNIYLERGLDVKLGTTLEGLLHVLDDALLHELLRVLGDALFEGNVRIGGNLTVTGTTNLNVNIQPQKPLTQAGSAVTAGNNPKAIAFSPLGEFVSAVSDGKVEIFEVDDSGNLSESAISTFTSEDGPAAIAWSPNWSLSTGGFVAITNADNHTVQVLPVDVDGNLSAPIASRLTGINPIDISFSPLGDYVFVTNQNASSNNVQTFGVDTSGNLSPVISTRNIPLVPESASWSPNWSSLDGGLIAIASDEPAVQIRRIDTSGNISSIVSSQFTASQPKSVSISPEGNYVAVANASGTVQVFGLDDVGNLSSAAISSQLTGSSPARIVWSPNWSVSTGGHIAVTSSNSNIAQIFDVDASGNISAQAGYANTGPNPGSIAWSPLGNIIGAANAGPGNLIQTFDVSSFS